MRGTVRGGIDSGNGKDWQCAAARRIDEGDGARTAVAESSGVERMRAKRAYRDLFATVDVSRLRAVVGTVPGETPRDDERSNEQDVDPAT